MTSFLTYDVLAGGSAVLLVTGLILARLSAYRPVLEAPGALEGEDERDTLAKYQPMARLLAEDDFEFLKTQPGYRPAIGAKLRRQRRHIFRLYLHQLAGDFHRLHAEARELVANSPEQYSDLIWILMRQQVTFWRAMASVELRLSMDWAGLGKVEVRGLLGAFEAMRLDLKRFQAPATAA